MRRLAPETAHALAGEYVLGTLRGGARRRFEAFMQADPKVAAIVREWEAQVTPLADRIAPVEPPERVWRAIESRIGPAPATWVATNDSLSLGRGPGRGSTSSSFWDSLAFWRTLGAMTAGAAMVLLSFFLYLSTGPRGEPVFVAVLQEAVPNGAVRTVISMHSPDLLRVRMVKPWSDTAGKSLQLWVMPSEGAPRSLGVVPNVPGDTMIEITATDPRVRGAAALALSLEPQGGSPTGTPTGPMVARGVIAPVKRT
jgi:anti-sigma-K factor RskA